ncbi:uncharacterized protein LOC111781489 [Cucurbita pepo subsp. pepo]|uniref:uncharacterized protein LOC111781489 n=1 Tax=Cucurbita pepo subsp. pepo TaxID=3664 RepID=UPI000C9D358D|nr:uncharacterized protein LOC111781489 [Cucurbita pepo subsp. pepo]
MAAAVTTTAVLWRIRLGSALRAAFACSLIGGVMMFGPASVRQLLSFPAFSYFTTISIVLTDAVSIGDAVRGVWHVMWAVVSVLVLSVPCLYLVGPERFTGGLSAAVAVAISAFVVALPMRTHVLTKRIAFGQLVIVYVGTVVHGGQTSFFMHPIRVASSTAAGALAAVVAMVLPYPRLASFQIRKLSRAYCENGCERMGAMVEGFGAKTKAEAAASMAEAKALSTTGTKLLRSIQPNLGGMIWERQQKEIAEKLEGFEVALRGMEAALTSPSIAIGAMDEQLCNSLNDLKPKATLKLQSFKISFPPNATTAPETKPPFSTPPPLNVSLITPQILPPSFFLRCMELLHYGSTAAAATRNLVSDVEIDRKANGIEVTELRDGGTENTRWGILSNILPTKQSLCFALKCSITLGLAVFLGLTYTKSNGYWSGLTVAISLATERQAVFTVANARAQGTAMGSIYGVLCCFILRKLEYLWLLPLLPWVVFSSFLVHSRMYGPAGATSSALGALLVLGRKNYGIPSEFANARITEACIGLICFLTMELIFNPTRAATLAKTEFSRSLEALQEYIKRVILIPQKNINFSSLIEHHKTLKSHVSQLEKFIAEARFEPNFWFTPFQSGCYDNLLKSLQKIVNILHFLPHEVNLLCLELNRSGVVGKEVHDSLSEDMDAFCKKVGCSLNFMEKLSMMKELQNTNKNQCSEMEMGKMIPNDGCRALALVEEDVEKIMGSFCQHANEILTKAYTNEEGEANQRGQMTLCLSSIGFCMECLMRETMAMEKEVHQLLKLENPSFHINLQELSTKVNAHHCK